MIKNMEQENIRNFCIIAHVDHGKSTLADRFLELTHTIESRDMKEQYLDRMDLERERGITIKLQPVRMAYRISPIADHDTSIADRLTSIATSNVNRQSVDKQITNNVTNNVRRTPNDNQQSAEDSELNSDFTLNLIDTPGHVDFSYEVSRSLAAVEGAILLVDATQGIQAQTLANLHQAQELGLDIIPVINKIDLANADVETTTRELANLLKIDENKILHASGKTGEGVETILNTVVQCINPPTGGTSKPTRALIFDSNYDSYRGVVAYVRVVDGEIKKGDKIKFFATGMEDQVLEVGYFSPDYKPCETLSAGEIGYMVTGLKEVSECKVGDTITQARTYADFTQNNAENVSVGQRSSQRWSAIQPLAGYKEVVPMVFAGIYTIDGEVNKLRESLGKLKLNDASLVYEPENSKAFGFGFRCGFLGTLHLEIIKERLEREYNLNMIITTPQVKYQRQSASGVQNQCGSVSYEEPWAKVEIVTPQQYMGQIMELLNNVRGMYKSTEYISDPSTPLGAGRVILNYEAPLASIIVGFYDKLKSASSGYASMNYAPIGYRPGDLVKMDILIAGEPVDVLSQIVHRSQLLPKAIAIVKRLKELIPRQMFDVTLQAAIGGKILARENISAMKKDVTGYLYGGDITRKKKLWAKQAKGKKKMKKLGRVDIPSDVFINLLKY